MSAKLRSANAAIKGYVYQFDKTILEILGAKSSSVVTVEGIEDIDVESATAIEAIQCKYLSVRKFSLALIREPIQLMLNHSGQHAGGSYRLYIYCTDNSGLKSTLTVAELKSCLTKRSRATGATEEFHKEFSDEALSAFVARLQIESGSEFSIQQASTRKALASALSCSLEDCADIFYPMALSIVLDLAIKTKVTDRKITRGDFIAQLNVRHRVYSRWHSEEVGIDRFVNALRRQLKSNQTLSPVKARVL